MYYICTKNKDKSLTKKHLAIKKPGRALISDGWCIKKAHDVELKVCMMWVWYSFICGAISFHYFPSKLKSDCGKNVSKQRWSVALIDYCKCISKNT